MLRLSSSIVLFFCLGALAGCASQGFQESLSHSSPDSAEKEKSDSKQTDAKDGKKDGDLSDASWDEYGRQMRSNQPVKKEEDGLKDFFVSPRAQQIERSLGVE